jgi:Fur family ferric uptake transcriptional regulator
MNYDSYELLENTLRLGGYSVTKQRRLVFELLLKHEPQAMHELYERSIGRLDRASLYRIIALFERLGIVQKLSMGWKYKLELSDMFTGHHHHITCLKCGRVIPIKEDLSIERFITSIAQKHRVSAVKHQLEIQGYCNSCREHDHPLTV